MIKTFIRLFCYKYIYEQETSWYDPKGEWIRLNDYKIRKIKIYIPFFIKEDNIDYFLDKHSGKDFYDNFIYS